MIEKIKASTSEKVIFIFILVLGLFNSKILSPLNKLWFKFGILLGKIISPLVMGIIFFLGTRKNDIIIERNERLDRIDR